MGTHCYIAKEVGSHQYRAIFCQLDGYLEEVGATLAGYYDTEERVDKLLDLGDIYSLAPKLDPDPNRPHEFLNRQEGVTTAFGRDYGETEQDAIDTTIEELLENDPGCEFLYVFYPNEGWEYLQYGKYDSLRNLKDALDLYGIKYRPEDQSDQVAPEQSDNGEEETYEQKM